ncbi:MAG: hypothetical protein HQL67_10925 [Magnetococcales bacterium]|nr:hypothetical protein [Magnetococcales bacterium]
MMDFAYGLIAGVLIVTVVRVFGGRDNTDHSEGKKNDMRLHTDHETGLQYLSVALGGITPRLDTDGKQMSVKNDAR